MADDAQLRAEEVWENLTTKRALSKGDWIVGYKMGFEDGQHTPVAHEDPRLDFGQVVLTLQALSNDLGWEAYLKGWPEVVMAWFSNTTEAALWLIKQSPEHLDTDYEHRMRPASAAYGEDD